MPFVVVVSIVWRESTGKNSKKPQTNEEDKLKHNYSGFNTSLIGSSAYIERMNVVDGWGTSYIYGFMAVLRKLDPFLFELTKGQIFFILKKVHFFIFISVFPFKFLDKIIDFEVTLVKINY